MGSCFSNPKCDVFLSFRGEDTRNGFTTYLYEALKKKKISTYMDHKLNKGDEISSVLLKAIKKAKLSVIVFSENYASSSWCLDELVQILERKQKKGQIVVPIFYGVDPSDVRKQKGSYSMMPKKGGKHKVKAWTLALSKAANISGWDSRSIRPESKLIKEIVKDIEKKLEEHYGATSVVVIGGLAVATAASSSVSC